jgi:cytochrome c biogenesis protein
MRSASPSSVSMSLEASSVLTRLETDPAISNKTNLGAHITRRSGWSVFASVKLLVALLALLGVIILLGAWCPQEAQVGQEKVVEQFGPEFAYWLIKFGVSDIFHSPLFMTAIALLSVNLVVASFQRVFPRLSLLLVPLPYLTEAEIERLPHAKQIACCRTGQSSAYIKQALTGSLKRLGYQVRWKDEAMTAEFGKVARLAPSITHVGLIALLVGVTITSWTGFSGFKPVKVGADFSFSDSEHSRLWVGRLPNWKVRVDNSRRENYPTGEAKQWYSHLTLVDARGRVLCAKEISVNDPLTFQGIDIYQSSWGLDSLKLDFNGHRRLLTLSPMGKLYAAFLPLTQDLVLIFSVKDQSGPVRVFAKRPDWQAPKLLGEINPNRNLKLGNVSIKLVEAIPVTGLQYKSDPGLGITYGAFAFIVVGVFLAMIPHRRLWGKISSVGSIENTCRLSIAGTSPKAKLLFYKQLDKLAQQLEQQFEGVKKNHL